MSAEELDARILERFGHVDRRGAGKRDLNRFLATMMCGAPDEDQPERPFAVAAAGNPSSEVNRAGLVARRVRHTRPSRRDSGQLTSRARVPQYG